MKRIVFYLLTWAFVSLGYAQTNDTVAMLEQRITVLENNIEGTANSICEIETQIKALQTTINDLISSDDTLRQNIVGVNQSCDSLAIAHGKDRETFIARFEENKEILHSRTLWAIVVFSVVLVALILYLWRRKKGDSSAMSEVRKAQDALQSAYTKMQEDSVKLDNKMVELIEKQLENTQTTTSSSEIDHSLALKVADEIVRIEINLSRMDTSIKGYRQLSKAVEHIKHNFQANGYEIVDMLGKPYNDGMKVIANFVPDDTLANGEQKITGITKPQINYNGVMIQSAQITVSQNI